MKILHLLYAGGTGGIEKMCKDIGLKSKQDDNIFWFVHTGGNICNEMRDARLDVIETRFKNRDIVALYKRITQAVRDCGVEIIVIHHPAPLIWIAALLYLRKRQRARVVVYAHNSYAEITKRSDFKAAIYNILIKRCEQVIAISEYVKSTFLSIEGLQSDKISVIYNGIATDMYRTDRSEVHGSEFSLLYVGRLIPEKGVDYLLKALSVMEHKERVSLFIVGDGPERERLEKMVKEYNLENQVEFKGIQRNVAEYLAKADVFIHPAVWEEGFGITVVEAMSAGLVCVTFAKGALPEIISDGINGFIVEECSAKALANKLDVVCSEIERNNLIRIRANAVSRAEDFTIESLLGKLHGLYCDISKKQIGNKV